MKKMIKLQIAVSMSTLLIATLLPVSVVARTNVVNNAGQRIGMLEEAKSLVGSDLKDSNNKSLGKLDDLVVDLESGRLLYGIASVQGSSDHFAIAPTILVPQASGKGGTVSVDKPKLSAAPKVDANRETQLGDSAFIGQVFQYYGVPTWWEQNGGSFNNVHKVSTLSGQTVKNVSNADIGKLDDAIVDLRAGRIPFVILTTSANASYAIPPNAFTLGGDKKTLTTGLDQNALTSAPRYTKGNVQMLANRGTATAIYSHYGKQAYFNGPEGLSPTGR